MSHVQKYRMLLPTLFLLMLLAVANITPASAFPSTPPSPADTLHPWAQYDMETPLANVDISKITLVPGARCSWPDASQGVAFDGTYFYTAYLDKLDGACNQILHRSALADVPGATQLNSLYYHPANKHLYVGANNYPNNPRYGWIWEGYASNLTHIATHPVEAFWNEGMCYANGYFWIVYDAAQIVSQFTTSWTFVADYPLDFYGALGGGSILGYQGCRFHGNYLYLTIHENGQPDDMYMHVYRWTGTGFEQYQKIRSPDPNATQGFEFYGNRAFFNLRPCCSSSFNVIANATITFGGASPDMYVDSSGNGHSLWSHNTSLTGGHPGLAQYFTGINTSTRWVSNSYMEISGIPAETSGWGAISVAVTARTIYTYGQILVSKHTASTTGEWFVKIDSATSWSFTVINGASVRVDAGCNKVVTDGQWHSFLATYDGAKMLQYTDGVLCKTTNQTGNIKTTQIPIRVGGYHGGLAGPFNFQGTIDNVTLWKNQVVNLTNLGEASLPPPPVIVPPVQPIHDLIQALAPFFGGYDLSGFVLGFVLVILVFLLMFLLFGDRIVDGQTALIPTTIGIALAVGLGFWPLWTPLFIIVVLVVMRLFFSNRGD